MIIPTQEIKPCRYDFTNYERNASCILVLQGNNKIVYDYFAKSVNPNFNLIYSSDLDLHFQVLLVYLSIHVLIKSVRINLRCQLIYYVQLVVQILLNQVTKINNS